METKEIDPVSVLEVNMDLKENSVEPKFDIENKMSDVLQVLKSLSLTSVRLGDYLIVMNAKEDVTILGEPYIAFQLWLEVKSGKAISRIWGQTVAHNIISDIGHLFDVCVKHFSAKPCLGCPLQEDEIDQKMQDFMISQTPVPRMISLTCQRVLAKESEADLKACQNCLTMTPPKLWRMKVVYSQDEQTDENHQFEEHQQTEITVTMTMKKYWIIK